MEYDELQRQVEKQLYQMVREADWRGQRMTVALSGGRDSVCLLHLLKILEPQLGYQLSAVHINHGLREEAERDENFCRTLCYNWQIPLTVRRVDTSARLQQSGESVEEAARALRYEALERLPKTYIALAHHQSDQAETLLLHLLRGSGLSGLCAMQAVRGRYLRPLLTVSAAELNAYLKRHGLPHVEDETNADTAFRRNKLRHDVLPLLQREFNEDIIKTLAQTTARLQADEAFLESQVPQVNGDRLLVAQLLSQPLALQRRMVRRWLKQAGLEQDLSQAHVDQMLDLAAGQTGRQISLPKGLTVARSYDILHICKNIPSPETEQELPSFQMDLISISEARKQWSLPGVRPAKQELVPALPEEKWFDVDKLQALPKWRTRRSGDFIMISGGRKKLKDFFIDEKVPRALRDQIPLLTDGAHVLWIYGYRRSDGARVSNATQRVLHVRRINDASR